jgi:hydrogenase-4 component E
MEPWLDVIAVLLILANLRLLGTSRLSVCIQTVAAQALLLGAVPLLMHADELSARLIAIAAVYTVIKAIVLPWLLRRAARELGGTREVEPFIGLTLSLLVGMGLFGVSLFLAGPLKRAGQGHSGLLIPVALFTIMVGLLVIISRKKAITQVVGYLVMENGIYVFGVAFAVQEPLLVEMGVLLDVLAAVFVMGLTIYHISREFDHIDTDRLSTLKD